MESKEKKQFCIVKGIVKKDNKFLFIQRNRPWDEKTHLKWEFPGGKVDFKETPTDAVCREVFEETGFIVDSPKLLPHVHSYVWEYDERISHVIVLSYLCNFVGGNISTSDKNTNQVRWLSKKEIKSLSCIPGTNEILNELGD
jgi:8-oxo-dGTP diphosphatase